MGANPDNQPQRARRKISAQTASCTYMYNRSDILVRRQEFFHDVLLELKVARRTKGQGLRASTLVDRVGALYRVTGVENMDTVSNGDELSITW